MNTAVAKLADAANSKGQARGSREPLKVLGAHPRTEAEIRRMEGRFGPYVSDGTTNATLLKSLALDARTTEAEAPLIADRHAHGTADDTRQGTKSGLTVGPCGAREGQEVDRQTT